MSMTMMSMMEHPESTVSAPALVSEGVVLDFCNAVQTYGDGMGATNEVASRVRILRGRLDNLRNLASLCRLAIVGEPRAFARVIDEMHCLSVDFPTDPLECVPGESEPNEDEPDDRVALGAAIDLLAGAAFVSKHDREQRDRFIIGVVRAIENAIAFPVTYSAEAAAYTGDGNGTVLPYHARLVIANATYRLLEGDAACVPLAPREIRRRLYCLARMWMRDNPVDAFFDAVSGPKLRHIVHWEDPARDRADDARVGDQVTLLVERSPSDDGCGCDDPLADCAVMFCPHAPAPVVRIVRDGLQVLVPEESRTGPIAIMKKSPDFAAAQALIARYSACFAVEWSTSIFASVRMDVWAFPTAFGPPILEILRAPNDARPSQNPVGPKTNAGNIPTHGGTASSTPGGM